MLLEYFHIRKSSHIMLLSVQHLIEHCHSLTDAQWLMLVGLSIACSNWMIIVVVLSSG